MVHKFDHDHLAFFSYELYGHMQLNMALRKNENVF